MEKESFFRDRCWANHITVAGGVLAVAAAREVKKENFGKAFVYSTISGIADWLDGKEARRFAKRHPEQAEKRQKAGAVIDQGLDKLRNMLILSSMISSDKTPDKIKGKLSAFRAREAVTLAGAAIGAVKFYRDEGRLGIPETPPSSPVGKETMWWIGAGIGSGIAAAGTSESAPELSRAAANASDLLLSAGTIRGVQASVESLVALREMNQMDQEALDGWQPDCYSPHIGQYAVQALQTVRNRNPAEEPIAGDLKLVHNAS